MATLHLLIKGKVQGVFYRASAKEKADELGIKGWIKNTEGADVEAVVTGTEQQLEDFVTWCWSGPPSAVVSEVRSTSIEPVAFNDFSVIRRTR